MSGSFSFNQRALQGIHSADTLAKPLYLSAASPVSATRRACSTARTSIQMMAGRSTRSYLSNATTVQVVLSKERPAISLGAMLLLLIISLNAATRDDHHSSGSCSAQPGRGCLSAYVWLANPTCVPSLSKRATRTLSVPPSIPRK